MPKAEFNSTHLGDGVVWIGSSCERAAAATRNVLWSDRADVPDSSPNFLWRVRVIVWARRSDCAALAAALEETAMALRGAKADLKVWSDDLTALLRTYKSCRFDAMLRHEPPRESRREYEDAVTFVFTTSEDPI